MTALSQADTRLLRSRRARPVLARLEAATSEFCVDRDRHVQGVALVVLRAKNLKRETSAPHSSVKA